MTSAIGSVAQLVSVIRRQLSAQAAPGAPAMANRRTSRRADVQAGRYADENLGALIEVRVRQIKRDDPYRGRKAFRVFLEAVLAAHFGPGMVNDPAFHQLVDDIQQAMEGHPECAPLVERAVMELLAEQ